MRLINQQNLIKEVTIRGTATGQFLWLLNHIDCYESNNGWIFALKKDNRTNLVLFDPIPPNDSSLTSFEQALNELRSFTSEHTLAFLGISEKYRKIIEEHIPSSSILIAKEPWIDLAKNTLNGKSAKGVRAGRNQAIRAGLRFENWTEKVRSGDSVIKSQINQLFAEWKTRNIIEIEGFISHVDIFLLSTNRHYFAVLHESKLEGLLIVTSLQNGNLLFFEDILLCETHHKGVSELLVTEARLVLQGEGKIGSLGSIANIQSVTDLPKVVKFLVIIFKFLSLLYPLEGLELFRKRFRPSHWDSLYLIVEHKPSAGKSWLNTALTLKGNLPYKISRSLKAWKRFLIHPLKKFPLTFSWLFLNTLFFAMFNNFKTIEPEYLARFAFSPNFPLIEWGYRSILCDFLTYSPKHYLISLLFGIPLLAQCEKKIRRKFLIITSLSLVFFDDFINYFLLVKPFELLHPELFKRLAIEAEPAIGNSLIFICLFGLLLSTQKTWKGRAYPILLIPILLVSLYSTGHYHHFVLRINYLLFYLFGHFISMGYLYLERKMSHKVARLSTPEPN